MNIYIYYIPGKLISCHTFGSVIDCILCTMSSSKGSAGWNISPIEGALDASDEVTILGANGSMPPTGAN